MKDIFTNYYPLYTNHTITKGTIEASYSTYLFGLFSFAQYNDGERGATMLSVEPVRQFALWSSNVKCISSIDELAAAISLDEGNIQQMKLKW